MLTIVDMVEPLYPYAGPGHWNDPDMLEVGNGGMSFEEYKSHFSLWAILAAPLMAGNDLAAMSAETKTILTNKEVVAIDQDSLGIEGRRVLKDGDIEVWARPLEDGGRAVVLFNRSKETRKISVPWAALDYPAALTLKVRDLWSHKALPAAKGAFSSEVPSHGVVMIRLGA